MGKTGKASCVSLSLGLGNPKPLGDPVQGFFPCPGTVVSIADFVQQHDALLSAPERSLVSKWRCRPAPHIPAVAGMQCLKRDPDRGGGREPVLTVQRSGGRSAYSPELGIKWKGCRPVDDGTSYPMEILPFGSTEITYTDIPFGTLTPGAVMREILGYSFFREHDLPPAAEPLCVYEYIFDKCPPGYCLVMASAREDRIEARIDYPACTMADVIAARHGGRSFAEGTPLGAELRFRGLNVWRWAERKSEILAGMHFAGGFRGVLNSNIGNDVLVMNGDDVAGFTLCDFDSFKVIDIPAHPDGAWLRSFLLWCVVEVIKGSLSILDYVDIPGGADLIAAAECLGKIYFSRSSLWKAYERRLRQEVSRRGWSQETASLALDEVKTLPAVGQALSSCILNSYYLRYMSSDRKVFYPHN